MQAGDLEERRRRMLRLERRVDRALGPFDRARPKVFSYPLHSSVKRFQRLQKDSLGALYPEDWANFRIVYRLLTRSLRTKEPERADFFFLPIFLPVFELLSIRLDRTLAELQFLDSGKPHLLFSSWDSYPRSTPFANPYAVTLADGDHRQDWRSDRRLSFLTLESTIDLWPQDLGLVPAVLGRPKLPRRKRPLWFCFVGSTCYDNVRADHVRGRKRRSQWDRLAREPVGFVGSLAEARRRFGPTATQTSVSRQSTFTLCPAGHARWTFRMSEAVEAGSIPVLLSDFYRRPLAPPLDWDRFSISLPESALGKAPRILRRLSPERLAELRSGVAEVQQRLRPLGLAGLLADELERRAANPWRTPVS